MWWVCLVPFVVPTRFHYLDRQIHIFTLPSLNPMQNVSPIRYVEALAVDHQHLSRPLPSPHDPPVRLQPVDFSVIKRNAMVGFSLQEERLSQSKVLLLLTLGYKRH